MANADTTATTLMTASPTMKEFPNKLQMPRHMMMTAPNPAQPVGLMLRSGVG